MSWSQGYGVARLFLPVAPNSKLDRAVIVNGHFQRTHIRFQSGLPTERRDLVSTSHKRIGTVLGSLRNMNHARRAGSMDGRETVSE